MSNIGKGNGWKQTDEARAKIKAKRALQTNVSGPFGHTPWNKGMKFISKGPGRPVTDEQKLRISQTLLGRKLSPGSIAKRTATRRANGLGFGGNKLITPC